MLQKVKVIQDWDSHWYVIPEDSLGSFRTLEEEGEALENWDEPGGFNEVFSRYRVGRDVNLIQLYADT